MTNPFTLNLVGKEYDFDGGERNFEGPSGTVGDFATFAEAFEEAQSKSRSQSVVRISDWNARANPYAPDFVFVCDGDVLPLLTLKEVASG